MAATEQLIDYLHGLSSPIGENRYPDSKWQLFIAWSIFAALLGDYVLGHEIDVDERKETEQRSLFDLFQRAMGAKKFILQTKDGNRLRQSGFYYKDRSHLLPSEDTLPGLRTSSTRFPPSAKVECQSSKGRFITKRGCIKPFVVQRMAPEN